MKKMVLKNLLESWDAGSWGEPTSLDAGVIVLRSTNFRDGGQLSFENQAVLSIKEDVFLKKMLVPGDILLEKSGGGPKQPVGRVAMFLDEYKDGRFICGNFISRLVSKKDIVEPFYLLYLLLSWHMSGMTMKFQTATTGIRNLQMKMYLGQQVDVPPIEDQRRIASRLKSQLAEVEKARSAAEVQLAELIKLGDAIIFDSLKKGELSSCLLGDVLIEVKKGIGESWEDYPVLGATRTGIAPAKEPPGKYPHKYKPIVPGTVFYNPMRILIGSIAFLDVGMKSGITSPDYVVLQGKEGVVDSRWFYYWLRSPLGEQCITSLARGAVRERMLFSRLAEGNIDLPDYKTQQLASSALAELNPMRTSIERQLTEINLLPQKILSEAFGSDPTVTK